MSFYTNSCVRKIRHEDYDSALRHAARLPDDGNLIVYPCMFCGGFHVGHKNDGVEARLRRYLDRWLKEDQDGGPGA